MPLVSVSFRMSGKVAFIEECLVTSQVNTKETGVTPMRKHMSLYLTFKSKGTITLWAFIFLVFVLILMS